jgi:hypothetical protein
MSKKQKLQLNKVPPYASQAFDEMQRLQKTLAVLIAVGCVDEAKAQKAYDIAGWMGK